MPGMGSVCVFDEDILKMQPDFDLDAAVLFLAPELNMLPRGGLPRLNSPPPFDTGPGDSEVTSKRTVFGLVKAASRGSLSELEYFLDLEVPPDSNIDNRTPLGQAIINHQCHCVGALLLAGADPNFTVSGVSPLMLAILSQNDPCISLFMELDTVVINSVDQEKTTTVMYAARTGNYPLTQILVQRCGRGILYDKNLARETVITLAASNGHKTYLQELLPSFAFNGEVLKAVVRNDSTKVRRLLDEEGFNPNELGFGGLSPLILSCMLDHRECLDALLEFQVLLSHFDDSGRTALHYAAACGNPYCMERLIHFGAVVSMTNRKRENSLIVAVKGGCRDSTAVAMSALLYEKEIFSLSKIIGNDELSPEDRLRTTTADVLEGEILPSLEAFDFSDKTALMQASKGGYLEIVEMLLESGASATSFCSLTKRDALIYAIMYGHDDVAEKLLECGASVKTVDIRGFSALYYAAYYGHLHCILLLLKAGAKITVSSSPERTALSLALDNGFTDCAETLMDFMSIEQMEKEDNRGRSAIIYAANNGNVDCLRQLFDMGLSLNTTDRLGNNALMYATASCYLDCMKFLIEEKKIPLHHKTRLGLNAVGMAAHFNVPSDILHYLIRAGSDIHSGTALAGILPHLSACYNGSERCLRILLAAGADITQTDRMNNGPVDYASSSGNPNVVRLVLEAEQDRGLLITDRAHRKSMLNAIDSAQVTTIRVFLEMEVFDWSWYTLCVNSLRHPYSVRMLAQSLVVTGVSPGNYTHEDRIFSPLTLALAKGDMATTKYLISNLYFTKEDYDYIRKDKDLSQHLDRMKDPFGSVIAKNLCSSPLPLSTLCFLSVSSAIAQKCGMSNRREVVQTLPIPEHFKTKLAFKEPISHLCKDEWINICLCSHVRGYGRKPLSPFLLCTQRPQPFKRPLYPCRKRLCFCYKDAVSFIDKKQENPPEY